jgi:hypothetical protein
MRIALADGSTVLQTWHAETGEAAVRCELPDGSQLSPIVLGWSSGDFAVLEVGPFVVPGGKRTVGGPSYEVIDGRAVESYEVEDIPAQRRLVRKSTITARLIAAGKMEAAHAALMASPINFARWIAADRPAIYFDDPDAIALLTAIEADVEAIMAVDE